MRILLATSFPVPGEYDGTAMLPLKIMRALRTRGVDVVLAHLQARPPWTRSSQTEFEGCPSFTLGPYDWVTGLRRISLRPGSRPALWRSHPLASCLPALWLALGV